MSFTEKDLALLNSEQNKPAYDTLFGLLENELENILDDTDILSMSPEREEVMGTCSVYFSSMRELLHTTGELMQTGFIESAGVLAASLWETQCKVDFRRVISLKLNPEIYWRQMFYGYKSKSNWGFAM